MFLKLNHADERVVKTSCGFIFTGRKIRNSRSATGCCFYFRFVFKKCDIHSFSCKRLRWTVVNIRFAKYNGSNGP